MCEMLIGAINLDEAMTHILLKYFTEAKQFVYKNKQGISSGVGGFNADDQK